MRALPFLAALCFLVLVLALPAQDAGRGPSRRTVGSSYETGPLGLSLARAVLASRPGAAVDALARPIGQAHLPPDAVVFRILGVNADLLFSPRQPASAASEDDGDAPDDEDTDPADADDEHEEAAPREARREDVHAPDAGVPARPAKLLTAAEERWIGSGGRLVIATAVSLPEVELQRTAAAVTRKHLPVLPTVRELHPDSVHGLGGRLLERATVVFSRGGVPIAVRSVIGRGELWVLSTPEVLDNAHLAAGDHLPLLTGLAGQRRPVFFDESVHGVEDAVGPAELVRRWGLGPSVVLAVAALALLVWRRRATLGTPAAWEDRRTESVDLLDSLSLLYLRALRPPQALALHRERLRHELQWRERLRPEGLEARTLAVLPGWTLDPDERLRPGEFAHRLHQLNDAFRRIRDPGHR
jgi:hypothetical protein